MFVEWKSILVFFLNKSLKNTSLSAELCFFNFTSSVKKLFFKFLKIQISLVHVKNFFGSYFFYTRNQHKIIGFVCKSYRIIETFFQKINVKQKIGYFKKILQLEKINCKKKTSANFRCKITV